MAACLYRLATGGHYLDFSLEPEETLRQIAEDPPLPFTERGAGRGRELEAILAQCLAKRPERRLADVETLARRLDAVATPATAYAAAAKRRSRACEGPARGRAAASGPRRTAVPTGLSAAPTSSLNYGAAGIAYALYRLACARDDASLLALADVWVTLARAHMHERSGCYSDELDITPETVGRISTFHTAAGVEAVATLIAHARGDAEARQSALAGFLEHSRPPSASLDLTLGRSSTLLACALLFEALMTVDTAECDALRRFGDTTMGGIWTEIAAYPPFPTAPRSNTSAWPTAGPVWCTQHCAGVPSREPPHQRVRLPAWRNSCPAPSPGDGASVGGFTVRRGAIHGWLVQRQRGLRASLHARRRTAGRSPPGYRWQNGQRGIPGKRVAP